MVGGFFLWDIKDNWDTYRLLHFVRNDSAMRKVERVPRPAKLSPMERSAAERQQAERLIEQKMFGSKKFLF